MDELFKSTWKWFKLLSFLKSGEATLNENVNTIDMTENPPKRQKVSNEKIAEKKMMILEKSMEFLSQPAAIQEVESELDIFGKMAASSSKKMNCFQQTVARKKINDIIYEIEISNLQKNQKLQWNQFTTQPGNSGNSLQHSMSYPTSPFEGGASTYSEQF